MDVLPQSLPDIQSVLDQLPDSGKKTKKISIRSFQEQTLYTIKTTDGLYSICSDTAQNIKPVTWNTIEQTAKKWVDAPILKIDTLNKRDQWIMYSRYEDEMPIYKFYFDDEEKHQLYISAKTAEVQQFTNKEGRFWAWMGAIPHKFYLPFIRQNTDIWTNSLTIGGVIALIAALSGIYFGLHVLCRRYKAKRKIESPYKKRWYRWHHILGLVFGIFLATFAFSGAVALQRIPQWIIKTHGDYRVSSSQLRGKKLPIDNYKLDYRLVINTYPNIKTIEWSHFGKIPVYNIVVGDSEISIDASSNIVKELYIPQQQIETAIEGVHGNGEQFTVSLINEYEEYYLSRKQDLALPVYKVEVDNADHSLYYINPKNGDFKYLNQSRKVKKWIFSGLHYLNIKYLVERPILWTAIIWIICIGGAFVSLSGIYLSFRYINRKFKKKNKHEKTNLH